MHNRCFDKKSIKNELKPWKVKGWVIPPKENSEFVAHMEQVLDIYKRSYQENNPVICMDESPEQLVEECNSIGYGLANVFIANEPLKGKRMVEVTVQKTKRIGQNTSLISIDYLLNIESNKMKRIYIFVLIAFFILTVFSCGINSQTSNNKTLEAVVNVPEFNADSAYQYIKVQVDFGPRVFNSIQHDVCGDYLAERLKSHGATVTNQYVDLTGYDGTVLKARNIIGSFKPEHKKRILLCAHWDTRPWADNDPNERNHHTPILGANDGASGVGILLEIARLVCQQEPALGIDIVFFDAEDYGAPQFYNGTHKEEYWCLGSQYWARFPHIQRYNARFGILLDMVGGRNAIFHKEMYSEEFAKGINTKVWKTARELGYERYFVNAQGRNITDDHLFINRIIRIPCIDIIPDEGEDGFGSFWHTTNDTMKVIDKSTLKAVGQTVLAVIYNEF